MKIATTIKKYITFLDSSPRPLGLIPTMGAIHNGHKELIKVAKATDSTVAVSIFVNPLQFGPHEDFDNYPRQVNLDIEELKDLSVDLVFIPSWEEIYPDNFSTSIDVGKISKKLEAQARPDHFNGVATIVCKLLSITNPNHAYFGEKDAQQCLVIEKMVSDLNIRTEVVRVPTIREPDGLAISSRNAYLTKSERNAATVIYKSLTLAHKLHSKGINDVGSIKKSMSELISSVPYAKEDYISIAKPSDLEELKTIDDNALISVAVFIGKTRLIDNIYLKTAD